MSRILFIGMALVLVTWLSACGSMVTTGVRLTPTAPAGTAAATPTVIPPPTASSVLTDTPAPTETAAITEAPAATDTASPGQPIATPSAGVPGTETVTGKSCGDILMLGANPPREASALDAENCFYQAYQVCSAATLTVTISGVDAGTINQFGLRKNGDQCQVTDVVTRYVAPRPTPAPMLVTCSELTQQEGGFLFKACGKEDVFVPAP